MSASAGGSTGSASTRSLAGNTNPSTSTTSLTQSIEKLDGAMATGQSNYNAWRFRIIRILKEKDLLSAIEDSGTLVSSSKDNQAFTIITLNIKDSQIPYIQDATTTREAWVALKEVHQGIGMNGRMVLMQRLWGLRMAEGEDMAQHLNQFRELANQLRGLSVDGKGMDDSELVTILTLSLPESYEPLVMALQSRSDTITFDTMAGRLLQESGRRQIGQSSNAVQGVGSVSQTAFTVQRPAISGSFRGRGVPSFKGRGRGGLGTRFRDHGVSNRMQTDTRRNVGLTSAQAPQGTKCYYCGKAGHWKRDCYKRKSEEVTGAGGAGRPKEFTFLVEKTNSQGGMHWIIDSGASQHLSRDRAGFLSYKTVSKPQSITIADGTTIEADGVGDIEITTKIGVIRLTDVWHVPNIRASLISVTRMVDAGYLVEFSTAGCFVRYSGVKQQLGIREGSLYYLMENPVVRESPSTNHANLGLSTNQSSTATLETWHRRLCHRTLDSSTIHRLASKVSGMHVSNTEGPKVCGICAQGRQHKEAHTGTREKATEILERVHSDICGPMQAPSLNGEMYFITFIDEMSGRVSISLLHSKDGALQAFEAYRARAEKACGKGIKALRSDGGGEYISRGFRKYLAESGIQHMISTPYNPSDNSLAERMNRTIVENARCILQDSRLGNTFWGHAVLTAAHIHNRIPSHSRNDKSPMEFWIGKVPAIGHLRIFGSTVWVHVPKERRRKLDAKSVECILIGYEEDSGSKVYRLWDAARKTILLSRDVIIDECHRPEEDRTLDRPVGTIGWDPEPSNESPRISEESSDRFYRSESITPPPLAVDSPPNTSIEETIVLRPPTVNRENEGAEIEERDAEEPQLRRSDRQRRRGNLFTRQANLALTASMEEPEPETLTDALNSAERVQWKMAWESELRSLADNNTWLVEPLPSDRTAVGCRWIFKKKGDGRYKARLVAKGYSQKAGIDYEQTFAPVAKFATIRVLLALACESNWEVRGMDVKTAFLNSELEETVYMQIPEGLSVPAAGFTVDSQQPLACRLLKSIYGLKQSPRAWYGRINSFFSSYNFIRSDADHTLFINYDKHVILRLYVDDLVLAAPTGEQIDWIRIKLHEEFSMTDLGELRTFLGLEIERNRTHRTLLLSQSRYIHKILGNSGMQACNPVSTPADPHIQLEKSSTEFEATSEEKKMYQSAVGSLMYAMLGSRPDIAYAVSRVSQYSTNPNQSHWTAVKRIFRYLAGTPDRGLCYGMKGSGAGFTDADWGAGADRKSMGGFTFLLNGAAISWNSKKQATVALSSTEAEYMALTQAVKESIWLQTLLHDFGAQKHVLEVRNIHIDNQGALALAHNPEYHARTKHIDIQYHFVRQHCENKTITLTYCPTGEMTADIFTKALLQPAFAKHILGLGLIDKSLLVLPLATDYDNKTGPSANTVGGSTGEGRCC